MEEKATLSGEQGLSIDQETLNFLELLKGTRDELEKELKRARRKFIISTIISALALIGIGYGLGKII